MIQEKDTRARDWRVKPHFIQGRTPFVFPSPKLPPRVLLNYHFLILMLHRKDPFPFPCRKAAAVLLDERVLLPEMHRNHFGGIHMLHKVLNAQELMLLLARIHHHKGQVNLPSRQQPYLFLVDAFLKIIKFLRLPLPLPPVQVARMVDCLACGRCQERHPAVGGEQRLDPHPMDFHLLAVLYIRNLFFHAFSNPQAL